MPSSPTGNEADAPGRQALRWRQPPGGGPAVWRLEEVAPQPEPEGGPRALAPVREPLPRRDPKDLLARRNQLEVMLAALGRHYPDVFRAGRTRGPEATRARQEWSRLRDELLAVEMDLLRLGL
jgi:hypothetical protein